MAKERYTVAVVELAGMTIYEHVSIHSKLDSGSSPARARVAAISKAIRRRGNDRDYFAAILRGDSWKVGDIVTADGMVE